jgi:hypothetical protein
MLLVDLGHVSVGARKTHGELIAQAERGVVPPVDLDPLDRQTRPLRELLSDQPGDDRWRDVRLVHGHDLGPAAGPASGAAPNDGPSGGLVTGST